MSFEIKNNSLASFSACYFTNAFAIYQLAYLVVHSSPKYNWDKTL
jgi:hypothetical protein